MSITEDIFQQFVNAETFYYDQFWLLIIIGSFLIFLWWIMVISAGKKQRKITLLLCLCYWVPVGAYLTYHFIEYKPLIEISSQSNPAFRKYVRKPFTMEAYSSYELSAYANGYVADAFENSPFYKKETMEEPVEFLGRDRNFAYIRSNQQEYKLDLRRVTFTDVSEAKRTGVRYQLIDQRFATVGYIPQSQRYLVDIQIPKQEETKEVDSHYGDQLRVEYKVVDHWLLK